MTKDFNNIFAVGPPGVGKADLGRTLAEATGRTHLSVGHMLREEAKKDTEEAQMINQSIQMAVLVATVCVRPVAKRKTCLSIRISETDLRECIWLRCTGRLKKNSRDAPTEQHLMHSSALVTATLLFRPSSSIFL